MQFHSLFRERQREPLPMVCPLLFSLFYSHTLSALVLSLVADNLSKLDPSTTTAKAFAWNTTEGKYFDESKNKAIDPTQLAKEMENRP